MFKEMKKRIKNEKGLTLIELLAVIVILAIVAAIAIPAIGNIIENSRVKGAKADAANILSAANIYFTENSGETSFTHTTPSVGSYISDLGKVDEFTVTKTTDAATKVVTTTVSTKGTAGKPYTIGPATLKQLEIDEGDTSTDKFDWVTPKTE